MTQPSQPSPPSRPAQPRPAPPAGAPARGRVRLRGLSTVVLAADDVAAAARWYADVLGVEPYFVSPEPPAPAAYVEIRLGDDEDELGLVDRRYLPAASSRGPGGAVAYWHVDDVRATHAQLLAAGATTWEEPVDRSGEGWVTSAVVDPFGNVLGLIHSPHWLARHTAARR